MKSHHGDRGGVGRTELGSLALTRLRAWVEGQPDKFVVLISTWAWRCRASGSVFIASLNALPVPGASFGTAVDRLLLAVA